MRLKESLQSMNVPTRIFHVAIVHFILFVNEQIDKVLTGVENKTVAKTAIAELKRKDISYKLLFFDLKE